LESWAEGDHDSALLNFGSAHANAFLVELGVPVFAGSP
jgi:hypothetical protein